MLLPSSDLRLALRQIARAPAFTLVTVATLVLGLAINTVFYTIANDLFFRPLPAHEPERLAILAQKAPAVGFQVGFSFADVEDLRRFVEAEQAALRQRHPCRRRVADSRRRRAGLLAAGPVGHAYQSRGGAARRLGQPGLLVHASSFRSQPPPQRAPTAPAVAGLATEAAAPVRAVTA